LASLHLLNAEYSQQAGCTGCSAILDFEMLKYLQRQTSLDRLGKVKDQTEFFMALKNKIFFFSQQCHRTF
jgi:hypothetical protein